MAAPTPAFKCIEPVPGPHVGEKIAEPDIPAVTRARLVESYDFGSGIEIARTLPIEEIKIDQRIVEEKIRIGNDGHSQRQVAAVEQLHGLVSLHVCQLAVVIPRDQKHAVALPLEDLLIAVAGPNRRQPSALKHVNHLVHCHSKRRQRLARRNLGDIGARDSFLPRELHKGRRALALSPIAELHRSQIFDVVPPVDRHAERLYPLFIRTRLIPKVCRRSRHLGLLLTTDYFFLDCASALSKIS